MPAFIYSGTQIGGKDISGEIEASSKLEAEIFLRTKRITVTKINAKTSEFSFPFLNRIKLQDISQFTRQFSAMSSAGLKTVL